MYINTVIVLCQRELNCDSTVSVWFGLIRAVQHTHMHIIVNNRAVLHVYNETVYTALKLRLLQLISAVVYK